MAPAPAAAEGREPALGGEEGRMRPGSLVAAAGVCAAALLAAPPVSSAAAPPSRNDPCSRAGRDTCGTLGVGFYARSRYGTRWFGDFRGAVRGEPHTFCIDLRYWYASRSYRYRASTSRVLRNRDGAVVPRAKQEKLAYAIARYGRTATPNRQAAVMLYVHSLMGDARPGELDPAGVNRTVAAVYRRIARDATRYHGPYRVEARLSDGLVVGEPATASVRVLSARGYALPHVRLSLAGRGADGLPAEVETDGSGLGQVALTPSAVDLAVRVTAPRVAASRPRIFVPTTAAAAPNGQRLAAPAFRPVSALVTGRARPVVTTAISHTVVRPGSPIFDRIRIQGLATTSARVEVELFGPFASRSKLGCTGAPHWHGLVTARAGETEVRSPAVIVKRVGFYTFRERVVLAGGSVPDVTTPCAETAETTLVAPRIVAGRGDHADAAAVAAGVHRPVRVRVPSLGIDAVVRPVGIDVRRGVLGLPAAIGRAGWWRDGMAPGSGTGAILIAGHVDSARAGAGAFFALRRVVAGARVQVATADGGAYRYRVVSVRSYRKSALPTSVYSASGAPRLVLVTCGGPFDPATGHYRDNVVVTAVPA